VEFENSIQFAVKLERCREVTITNCQLNFMREIDGNNKDYGFQVHSCEEVAITGCTGYKARHFVVVQSTLSASNPAAVSIAARTTAKSEFELMRLPFSFVHLILEPTISQK